VTEGLTSSLGRQLTTAEKTALEQFGNVLKVVNQQKVLARQEASFGELTQMFKPGGTNSLTLAGQRILLENTNVTGTTKLLNTSAITDAQLEKQVFAYANELSGGVSIEPVLKNGVPLEGRWTAKLADGTTINVRNVSSSETGRWTIDIQGNPGFRYIRPNYKDNQYEIKFK
jgi:hypothetical protein